MAVVRRWVVFAWLALFGACATSPAPEGPLAEPWPAADALFRRDPRWLGGDAVYSVDLGGDRILWLFGDSFVATDDRRDRTASVMVRNTVAVQQGRDPERAVLSFGWRTADDGRPAAFFPDDGVHGYWPLHGIRLAKGPLLLFQTRVRNTPGEGLGFAIDGWRILRVDDPDAEPQQWQWREVVVAPSPMPCTLGTAVWRDGDHVVALGTSGHGPHRGMLGRFRIDELRTDRASAQWWDGGCWSDAVSPGPQCVLDDAGPECSMHAARGAWLHVYSRGFGRTTIAVHTAPAATGPWSAPRDVFTPPESSALRPFVYAGKAHPEMDAGPGWLAVSYASNAFDFAALFTAAGQHELYWPRFWRMRAP